MGADEYAEAAEAAAGAHACVIALQASRLNDPIESSAAGVLSRDIQDGIVMSLSTAFGYPEREGVASGHFVTMKAMKVMK